MLDIKLIRDNPDALDAALAKRGAEPAAAAIVALDEERRAHIMKVQEAQTRRNAASKEIGMAMGQGDTDKAEKLKAEVGALKTFLQDAEATETELTKKLTDALSRLPNMPLDDVPVGADENDNIEVRKVGEKPSFDFAPKEHFELGEALGQMDFERGAKLSGSRFTVLSGGIARLERALGQFMLDVHTGEHGYTEVNPPLLVRDDAMYGTGQLPKFTEDLYRAGDDHWLIPTAEVSLTNLVSEEIVDLETLPRRYTALTPCFRSEAGSAGRDTKGYLRQHQFYKVEMVSITDADSSLEEHERMTKCAETILEKLGLHFRTVVLCTGDMGFGARKTYDIEVWLPGQNAYREISSCSVCGDFQARRMNARYKAEGEKQTTFVHTLNGSGVAVGRALIAVMENYQNADGSITVPAVLRPYMGGVEVVG
ncbi:MAG: serine--tRNA ligase [Ahrensia sp.]